jgi:hypothetical protein
VSVDSYVIAKTSFLVPDTFEMRKMTPRKKHKLHNFIKKNLGLGAGSVAPAVERLPGNCEALSSKI